MRFLLQKSIGGFIMLGKEMLEQVMNFSRKPALFENGTGNIWTDPYLKDQMLYCHLDLNSDSASRNEKLIQKAVDFLNERLRKGGAVLDLCCGPGLYAEKLAQSGHSVTGVDISENSLQYARNSALRNGWDIKYLCKDILSLDYNENFDGVVQIYGEMNTFSDQNRDKLFAMIHKALKPEGVFIFDVTTPICHEKMLGTHNWYAADGGFWRKGKHVVLEDVFGYDDHVSLEQYIVIDEKEVKVYRTWFHDYTKEAIQSILKDAGFTHVQVIESLYSTEAEDTQDWLTVIAQK